MEGVSGRRVSIKTGGQPREKRSPSGQEDQQPLGRGQPQVQGLDSGLGGWSITIRVGGKFILWVSLRTEVQLKDQD